MLACPRLGYVGIADLRSLAHFLGGVVQRFASGHPGWRGFSRGGEWLFGVVGCPPPKHHAGPQHHQVERRREHKRGSRTAQKRCFFITPLGDHKSNSRREV